MEPKTSYVLTNYPFLKDVLNVAVLNRAIHDGYIREQVHPTEPLKIFNYTQKAVFDGVWNEATRMCRGLIINTETLRVVARPLPKFFNYGEDKASNISLNEIVTVTDKIDGSLGIKYWMPKAERWAIATRGSFTSEQALHATEKLQALLSDFGRGFDQFYDQHFTELFEIVYPENRIVLDYGDRDALVFLAAVHIADGDILPADSTDLWWTEPQGFECTETFGAMTFAEALAREPRPNAEGIVVTAADNKMLKIKQSDYVALHRAISKLSARSIWEAMGEGATLDQIKFGMPEEFWDFIEMTYNDLTEQQATLIRATHQTHTAVIAKLNHDYGEYGWDRKHYAALASQFSHRNLLFLLLDDRPLEGVVWKSLKPANDGPFFKREEDVS